MLSHIFYDLLSPRILMSSSISAIILSKINYQQHKTLNINQLFSLMIIIWFVEQKTTHQSCLYPNTQANLTHITIHATKINCSVCCLLFGLLNENKPPNMPNPNTQANLTHITIHTTKTNCSFCCLLFGLLSKKQLSFNYSRNQIRE